MIPDQFREFDQAALTSFDFLVHEKGCSEPTVEYWRDYFLTYHLPEDVTISIGTERGMLKSGWLGLAIDIAYRDCGNDRIALDEKQ